jgi:hypothetical protein
MHVNRRVMFAAAEVMLLLAAFWFIRRRKSAPSSTRCASGGIQSLLHRTGGAPTHRSRMMPVGRRVLGRMQAKCAQARAAAAASS